jgi:hypothetical protein
MSKLICCLFPEESDKPIPNIIHFKDLNCNVRCCISYKKEDYVDGNKTCFNNFKKKIKTLIICQHKQDK